MSSKATKLFGIVRRCQNYNVRWHDFTLQKNHLFGTDEKGYFVTAGEPDSHNRIKVYRCKGVPELNPDFYRWHATYERKGGDLYQKIMEYKRENPGLKVEFKPLEKEKDFAPCKMRKTGNPRLYKHMIIPGGGTGPKTEIIRRPSFR